MSPNIISIRKTLWTIVSDLEEFLKFVVEHNAISDP